MILTAYTDGSCNNHLEKRNRKGGWAFIILEGERIVKIGHGINRTFSTSQTMELTAVIRCLEFLCCLKDVEEVNVYSDSAYIVNCFKEKWYERWILFNFLSVKNEDFWRKLLDLSLRQKFKVNYHKVKGHSGNKWNEFVDKIAGKYTKK